ncbi:MAG: substrate-binding domain-containing protein [Luteolibacter sp.]
MEPLRKLTVAGQVAGQMRDAILAGEFRGILPGSRDLTKRLGVSPTSLREALAMLVADGVLHRAGSSRRYAVGAEKGGAPDGVRARKLWIVEPVDIPQPSALPMAMLKSLESRVARRGWTCEWSMEVAEQSRSHRKRWDQLLALRRPDAVLMVGPHRKTATWAANCGVPVCCFGGDVGGLGLDTLAFDTSHMLVTALEELFKLGHREIFLPLTVSTPGFVERVHGTMGEMLAREGVTFSREWHSPVAVSYSPDALLETVVRRFRKRRPTAVLSFGSSVLTLMGYLLKLGIRVPDEVSVVTLGGDHDIAWLRPTVAHFDFAWHEAAKRIARWLESGPKASGGNEWKIVPEWVKGATLGRATV